MIIPAALVHSYSRNLFLLHNAINLVSDFNLYLSCGRNAIQQDMNEWRSSSAWPLSCYAYKKEGECLPNFTEVSPEELRWEAYQANKAGNPDTYMQSVRNLIETQMKVWQQYSNITDEEVSQMVYQLVILMYLETTVSAMLCFVEAIFVEQHTQE